MRSITRRHLLVLCLLGALVFLAAGAPGAALPGQLAFTLEGTRQELVWIPGDPHHHSNFSDGRATVAQIFANAKDVGLGWVCIVDHRSAMNGNTFQEQLDQINAAVKDTGLIGLQGEEIGSRNIEGTNGHLLVYNFPTHDIEDNDRTETELLTRLNEVVQDAIPPLGILAHPYDPFHPWSEWGRTLNGGVEIMNGATDKGRPPSTKILSRWDWYLGHQLADGYFGRCHAVGMAGSDGHTAEVGGAQPVTYLALPERFGAEDLLAAISAGRVIASSRLGLLADLAVNETPIGGVASLRLGQPLLLFARFAYGDGTYQAGLAEVRFIRGETDGRSTVLQKMTFKKPLENRPPKLEFKVPLKSYLLAPSYYRLEAVFVTKGDPAQRVKNRLTQQYVYTNPVFVRTINCPICLAAERTPITVSGTDPKECLSFPLELDPEAISELQARVILNSSERTGTGIELVLFDQDGKRIAGTGLCGLGRGKRSVSCLLEPKSVPPGRYRLAIVASNTARGTGSLLAQALFATWRQ